MTLTTKLRNINYDSEYGSFYTNIICPKCNDNLHIMEGMEYECSCGYKWTLVIEARGVKND